MRTTLAIPLVVFALLAVDPSTHAQSRSIPAGASVYIENMDALFEADFRKELTRQNVALNVVASRDEATVIVTGAEQADQMKVISQDRSSMVVSFRRSGKVTVKDKASDVALWSGSWEVRSLSPKDNEKSAANLVGKLKKAVRAVK